MIDGLAGLGKGLADLAVKLNFPKPFTTPNIPQKVVDPGSQ